LWLAFEWSNFFPICGDCRPEDPTFFPVNGNRPRPSTRTATGLFQNELPGFYFPGELSDPERVFLYSPTGRIVPIGNKAAATLAHFKLNRPDLVDERKRDFDHLIGSIDGRVSLSGQEWSDQFHTEPFGGARYLFLRRLVQRVGNFGTVPRARRLSPSGLREALLRWRDTIDLGANLQRAADTVGYEDSLEPMRMIKEIGAAARPGADRRHGLISQVEITTYKSLEKIVFGMRKEITARTLTEGASLEEVEPETPGLLILGENATGKSSILEAIALACLPSNAARLLDLDARSMTLNPEYLGAEAATACLDARVAVSFYDGTERTLVINARPGAKRPFLQQANREEAPLVFAYGAHRLYDGKKRRRATRHYETLFHDDRQLSNPEAWLRDLAAEDPEALDEVISTLRHIIQIDGEFESIAFVERGGDAPAQAIMRVRKRRPDNTSFVVMQPLAIASSGYRAILALVCDVLEGLFKAHDGDARRARLSHAIILIDEIEAHLHPRWKLHIIAGLRRALPRATFIITSHDPLCLRGMFNGEVMALNRYQNVTGEGLDLPERVERVPMLDNVETMTIEQLLTSDLFQLLSTDGRETERNFARIGDLLTAEEAGHLGDGDASILKAFRSEIAASLPFGRDEIPRLVQEAVADYLRERRQLDAVRTSQARQRAKDAIKDHLRSLLA